MLLVLTSLMCVQDGTWAGQQEQVSISLDERLLAWKVCADK